MKKEISAIRFAGHVTVHPLSGFWDLKWEKQGKLSVSLIIFALALVTYVIKRCYAGFIFNTVDLKAMNILLELMALAILFVLWCASNWCLTSLMDGKGTFRDITIATGYALTPYVALNIPLVILSHFMVADESVFYYGITSISLLWCGILLFCGVMMTHDYSVKRTILTVICILIGMAVMLFLGMLLFSILQKIFQYIYAVYIEITYRI